MSSKTPYGTSGPPAPVEPLDRMFQVVAISDGYLLIPHPTFAGDRLDLSQAMHAATPQLLGEKCGAWVTALLME